MADEKKSESAPRSEHKDTAKTPNPKDDIVPGNVQKGVDPRDKK